MVRWTPHVAFVSLCLAANAYGQPWFVFDVSGQIQSDATYEVVFASPGVDPDTDIPFSMPVTAGMSALEFRNAALPEFGFNFGTGGEIRIHSHGNPGGFITGSEGARNFFVRFDGGTWVLLEPGVPTTLNGLTFNFRIWGATTETTPVGAVPAVGTWGLLIMLVLLVSAASVLLAKRQANTA